MDEARYQESRGGVVLNNELRERAILPILIPVGAIIVTEIFVFFMSRILLGVGKDPAVVIALGTALAILFGAALIAARPRLGRMTAVGPFVLLLLVVVVAGAVAYERGPAYEKEEAANRPKVSVTAANVAFSTKTLKLGASGTEIDFSNDDNQPHNIAIFKSAKDLNTPLFRGTIVQGGASAKYEVGKLAPGSYYFHCDVHPQQMTGTAVVG